MQALSIPSAASREEVVDYLESVRGGNTTAHLAFAAYRDMSRTPWKPFIKAAMERNPVCIEAAQPLDASAIYEKLASLAPTSIYDGKRMAQPDEVWNFGRGDGLEKALCFMNIIKARFPQDTITLKGDGRKIAVKHGNKEYGFESMKGLELPQESDFS